jgi:hypothetical protein
MSKCIPYPLLNIAEAQTVRPNTGELTNMSLNKPKDCSKVKIYYSTGDDTWTQPASHMPDSQPYSLTWKYNQTWYYSMLWSVLPRGILLLSTPSLVQMWEWCSGSKFTSQSLWVLIECQGWDRVRLWNRGSCRVLFYTIDLILAEEVWQRFEKPIVLAWPEQGM